jgi:hypothetical protein
MKLRLKRDERTTDKKAKSLFETDEGKIKVRFDLHVARWSLKADSTGGADNSREGSEGDPKELRQNG